MTKQSVINKNIFFSILLICSTNTKAADIESKLEAETYIEKMGQIRKIAFHSKEALQNIELFYDDNGFHVLNGDKIVDIAIYNIEPMLRGITKQHLNNFLNHGYINLSQINEDEYILRANIRIKGGGIFSKAIKWLVIEVAKQLAINKSIDAISHVWNKFWSPDPAEVQKVKDLYTAEALDAVDKAFTKLDNLEMFNFVAYSWYLGSEKLNDVTLKEYLQTADGQTMKDEIILRITEAALKGNVNADAIYESMEKSATLQNLGLLYY